MKTLQDFERFYETDLRPVLERLEGRRRRIVRKFKCIVAGTVVGVLALIAVRCRFCRRSWGHFPLSLPPFSGWPPLLSRGWC